MIMWFILTIMTRNSKSDNSNHSTVLLFKSTLRGIEMGHKAPPAWPDRKESWCQNCNKDTRQHKVPSELKYICQVCKKKIS